MNSEGEFRGLVQLAQTEGGRITKKKPHVAKMGEIKEGKTQIHDVFL